MRDRGETDPGPCLHREEGGESDVLSRLSLSEAVGDRERAVLGGPATVVAACNLFRILDGVGAPAAVVDGWGRRHPVEDAPHKAISAMAFGIDADTRMKCLAPPPLAPSVRTITGAIVSLPSPFSSLSSSSANDKTFICERTQLDEDGSNPGESLGERPFDTALSTPPHDEHTMLVRGGLAWPWCKADCEGEDVHIVGLRWCFKISS